MKKLFAIMVSICMVLSGLTVFAAEDTAAAEDAVLISAPAEDVTEGAEATEETEKDAETEAAAEEAVDTGKAEAEDTAEGAEAPAEEAEKEEATDAPAEEAVEIDAEAMSKTAFFIGGERFEIGEGLGAIEVKDGVVFVPVRAILEAVGYQVSWSAKERMVMGANPENGAMFVMQLDNVLLFYTDGTADGKLTMEAEPFMKADEWRTYAPLKGVAEAIGFKVGYDKDAALITLGK